LAMPDNLVYLCFLNFVNNCKCYSPARTCTEPVAVYANSMLAMWVQYLSFGLCA
jgi:hypothetical protein